MAGSARSSVVTSRPFDEIVAEHGPVVLRVCRAMLGKADADDAWSETFLAALRAYPRLRPESNVKGWLVTIAHRKAIDQIRKRERSPQPSGASDERPSAHGEPELADGELQAAVLALPPKQRAAVALHDPAELPSTEVGAVTDSSEAAARRSAADGIASLRRT
jgi:RNA polymerase sigma factor (sigma-70 family)